MKPEVKEEESVTIGDVELGPGSRIAGYVFDKLLGKGGMAWVILARDPDNQPVALKILRTSKLDSGRARFCREYKVLTADKFKHPSVIEVLAHGDIHGHPYFVMEYVDGQDLHQCVRAFKDLPWKIRWRKSERILKDLCQALEYIHRKGLVHRDIKPSNILVDNQGRAKLTDFGIVKELDPSANPDLSNTLVGTWAYASPEQIKGDPIDHRSDLYSMGVILFVMLTGRRPFVAKDMAGYLELHKDYTPPRVRDLVPECPEYLDEICHRLLEKEPRLRFQSAPDVLYFLESSGNERQTEDYSFRLPIVGRDLERGIILDAIAALTDQRGQFVLVQGPSGIGRSRLLEIAMVRASRMRFPLLQLQTRAHGVGAMITSLTIDLERVLGPAFPADLREVMALWSKDQTKIRGDLRYRVQDGLRNAIETILTEGPALLVIDDLQKAPLIIIDLVTFLCRTLVKTNPLLIIVSSSDPSTVDISRLGVKPIIIEPKPLTKEQVNELLVSILGSSTSTNSLSNRLHQETEGNPLFLSQFLQMLRQRRIIIQSPGGFALAIDAEEVEEGHLEIPQGIRRLLGQRLTEVPQENKPILNALAVAKQELDIDLLADILKNDEVFDSIAQLVKLGILKTRSTGSTTQVDFAHGKFGDIIYRDLSPERRMAIHKRFAEIFEERGSHSATAAATIGEHFRLAGEAGKAYLHLVTAAKRMHERSMSEEARQLAEQASSVEDMARLDLSTSAFSQFSLDLLLVRADIQYGQGEWKRAENLYIHARDLAKTLDLPIRTCLATLKMATTASRLGDLTLAAELRSEGVSQAKKIGDKELEAEAIRGMAADAWAVGDLEKCAQLASKGLTLCQGEDLEKSRAELLVVQATLHASQGHIVAAINGFNEAEGILKKLGLKRERCLALLNLAECHHWRGDLALARDRALEVHELSSDVLYKIGQGVADRIAGTVALELELFDEAQTHLDVALKIAGALKISQEVIAARYAMGRLELLRGDYSKARSHLSVALARARNGDPEGYLSLIKVTKAQMLLYQKGDLFQVKQLLSVANSEPDLPRQIQAIVVASDLYLKLDDKAQSLNLARLASCKAQARGLNLWAMDALIQISKTTEDPNEAKIAQNKASELAKQIYSQLPGRMAVAFRARKGVAALL